MAKCTAKMPDDFIEKVSKLGNRTDEILGRVLAVGGEVVEDKVRSNLSAVIGKNTQEDSRSTGQLLAALGTSPARVNRDGDMDVKIGFSDNRSDGRSNSMIAGVLEYGKHGQPPKPFMKPAKSASKAAAINAMVDKLNQEVESL